MKCDELKVETIVPQGCTITLQMYPKAEVDAAIAELYQKLEGAKNETNYWCNNLKVFVCMSFETRTENDRNLSSKGRSELRKLMKKLVEQITEE